jgi:Protein of unknown function (DUF1549)/Protein of unknown function (DUF1553)
MRTSDLPVAQPIMPNGKALRQIEPTVTSHKSPAAKLVILALVCVASLLIGGFVLPSGRESFAVAPERIEPVKNEPVVVPIPVVAAPALKSVFAKPQAAPSKPNPLDAAPQVVPQLPAGAAYELASAIDHEIDAALTLAKVTPSPLADDAEFLRRATLDLTGTIPTYDRTITFLLDGDPHKRAKLIDELLASPEYGKLFARQWADLLIKRDFDSNKRLDTEPFVKWMAGQLNQGAGWDAIVREILTASGKEADTPQALFYLANQDNNQPSPPKLVGATGNLFMGVQIQCAECHVHPLVDKWTQKDFWGMAAFFAHMVADRETNENGRPQPGTAMIHEVEKKAAPRPMVTKKTGEKEIKPGSGIAIPDPTDNKKSVGTAKAKFFEGAMPTLKTAPYRPTLAKWITSGADKYFAANAVNRLWAHLFARGLIQPVEDLNDLGQASHPAALKLLADGLVKNGYDLKFALRAICNTNAYQRTSRPLPENAEADEKLFARMPVKVVGAHELLASLITVTGFREPDPQNRRPMGQLNDNPKRPQGPVTLARFFDTREYDDDVTDFPFGVPQVLKLMNTNLTHRASAAAARIAQTGGNDRNRVIEDLYLAALTRRPRPEELERMKAFVAKQSSPQQGYSGVMWALLNSAEFVSNH